MHSDNFFEDKHYGVPELTENKKLLVVGGVCKPNLVKHFASRLFLCVCVLCHASLSLNNKFKSLTATQIGNFSIFCDCNR